MKRIANKLAGKLTLAAIIAFSSSALHAQSTTGSIVGEIAVPAGKSVVVESTTGLKREVAVGDNGRYEVSNLPLGNYRVSVLEDGKEIASREKVGITLGASTTVSFTEEALQEVVVSTSTIRNIDVSTTDARTVISSEQLEQLPLGRTAEAVALLAPGVVENTGGFRNGPLGGTLATFGGSAASENAYYLNGFNSTNPANGLGGLTLPFGAIDQQEIFTGGYGAQYGRSNGGVINQVGKHGTNDWRFGVSAIWQPDSLSSDETNLYWREDGSRNGAIYQPLGRQDGEQKTYSAYVGGPILQDRLFFFVAAEYADASGSRIATVRDTSQPFTDYQYKQKRAYAKLDWRISDNHLLELTGAQDRATTDGVIYNYDYTTFQRGTSRGFEPTNEFGPRLYVAKYTGNFGDNFTVTALYGKDFVPYKRTPIGYDPSLPIVNANDSTNPQNPAYLTGGVPITNSQTVPSISDPDQKYEKDNQRLNIAWRIGDHQLDFGIDNQKSEGINIGSVASGPGYSWTYGFTNDPSGLNTNGLITQSANSNGGIGAPSPALVDPVNGSSGYYVIQSINSSVFSYEAKQKAYYVEDHWQLNDKLLLSLGLRSDQFNNLTPFGDSFIDTGSQIAPRLGFSWDVKGDSTLKVYGNVGRYYLGLPLSPVGLFTPATVTDTYFTYSGINADGTPVTASQLGYPVSANSRFGRIDQDVRTAVANDIKGENQDEFILGADTRLPNQWIAGVRATYRRLNEGIDDINVDALNLGLVAAAQAAGLESRDLSGTTWYWDPDKTFSAALINPGSTNKYNVIGWDGQLHQVSVTNEQAQFPEFKRDYIALEFNLERPFDGKWFAKFNYVLSHSYGTTEGQLRSDLFRANTNTTIALPGGTYTGQTAVSTTQSWDQAALMEHMNGDQANDHRHQLKIFGFYQFTDELGVSANLSLISGAPRPCLAEYYGDNYEPGNHDPAGYGGSTITGGPYHFCFNPETGVADPSPPGSHGRLGWVSSLDLGVSYKPGVADGHLAINFNVFNVFNQQTANTVYPFSQLPDLSQNPLWNQPVGYQSPRNGRLTISYDF